MSRSVRMAVAALLHYVRLRAGGNRWKDRASFERWQERRVVRHLRFVRRRSAFYRELWGEAPLEAWRSFPTIDKRAMMDGFDALNTAGIRKENAMRLALDAETSRDFQPSLGGVTVGLSSGTSGSRGLFLVDEGERGAWVGAVLAKVLHAPPWRPARIAFFLRANSNLYESVGKSRRLKFQYYDLLDDRSAQLDRLNEYRPTVLVAPPSMLRELSRARGEGTLRIAPERIVSVAEVLEPIDEAAIRAAFGVPVHQVYQCTEGFLGSACREGTLHLNEDIVCIQKEPLPGGGRRFVPIVTDFSRRTQPIVRYRLNDVLVEAASPCRCGSVFTAIERIEGRCDDILYFRDRENGAFVPVYADYVSRAIIAATPDVEEYRVVQTGEKRLELALRLAGGIRREEAVALVDTALIRLFERAGVAPPEIVHVAYGFRAGATKLRRVERAFDVGAGAEQTDRGNEPPIR